MDDYEPSFEEGAKLTFTLSSGDRKTGTVAVCELTADGEKVVFLDTFYYLLRKKDSTSWRVYGGGGDYGETTVVPLSNLH